MEFDLYNISEKGSFSRVFELYENETLVLKTKKNSIFTYSDIDILDAFGQKIFSVSKPFEFFKNTYKVWSYQNVIATISKSALKREIEMTTKEEGDFRIDSDLFKTEFIIYKNEMEIGKVSRKRFRRKNKYGIVINKKFNSKLVLTMIIILALSNYLRKKKN